MKKNIVILPGWRQNSDHWQVVISKLKSSFGVHFIDLPGFGKEKLVSKDWEITNYVSWAKKKINKLFLDKLVLLGHSFGGRLAIDIASQNPSWLEGLVIYASPCFADKGNSGFKVAHLGRALPPKFKSKLIHLVGSEDYLAVKGSFLEKPFKSAVNYDQSSKLGHIKVPTLVFWGDKDREVPLELGKRINKLVDNSKLVVVKGAGHDIHLRQPNLFYGKIKQYLESF